MDINKAKDALAAVTRIADAAREAGSDQLTRSQLEDFLTQERRLADEAGIDLSNPAAPSSAIERSAWLAEELRKTEYSSAFAGRDLPRDAAGAGPADEGYARAFGQWLRGGLDAVEDRGALQSGFETVDTTRAFGIDAETRAMASLSGADGGYTVPEGFWNRVEDGLQAFGGFLKAPITRINTDTGADLPVPTGSPAEAGEIVGENTAVGEEDVPFGQKVMKGWTYSSKIVRIPVQLIQDSGIDVEGYVASKLGERIGRALAPHVLNGDGVDKPQGLLQASQVVHGHTATGTDTIARTDLIDLQASLDLAYAESPSAAWVASRGAWADLAAQETSDGNQRYPELNQGRLLGKPFIVDVGMPTFGTGEVALAYGDMSAYWLRTVRGVTLMRLSERYAERLQVGLLAFARFDGALIGGGKDQEPVKTMSLA